MATGGVSDLDRGTDETFDFLCSMCQEQKKNVEGEHFCADCSDYYCSTCVKVHNVVPALRNHKILNKVQFMSSMSVHFPAVPTERCRVHGHKPVDMFCQQHDSVGCATCMVVKHSECKEKFYVPDYIKNNATATTNPNNIVKQMDDLANHVAELQKEFIKEKENLKSSKDKSLKQIQRWRIKINKLLDTLENKTIQALEQRFQSLTGKIENVVRELQASTTDIQSAQNSLKSAGGNMAQMFVSIKTANEVAYLVQEKVNTTKHRVSSTEISCVPHRQLHSFLKEMQGLGDISLTENLQSKSTAPDSLQQVTKTQTSYTSLNSQSTATSLPLPKTQTRQQSYVSQSQPSLLQVKSKKRYTVTVNSDTKVCSINSACILTDGTIILADYNNSKLKRVYGTSYSVTDYCDVPGSPWQVGAITDQEVAVCCGHRVPIQFVSIGRTMQKTRQINTGFPCFALAYADSKLFISDRGTSVYVYSVSGDRQQQFSKDQSGQQIFSDIRSLAVSSDHSKIYVTDNEKGFIILDTNGQFVGQYNGPELKDARSVCLFKNDNVLVCGWSSKNVLQFSPDGKLQGEILKTDVQCQVVCCNKDNTKLIVGLPYQNEVEVYDIK